MVISRKKCQIVASSRQLANSLQKALAKYRFKAYDSVKNLGHDFGRQVRRKKTVLRNRVSGVRRRANRFRSLKHHKKGLSRVFRGGGIAAATYGVRVLGMSDSGLLDLRAVAGYALFGKIQREVSGRTISPN